VEDTKQALENGTCSEEDSAETVPEIPSHIIVTTVTGSDSDSECSSSIDDMLDTSEAHFYPMQDQAEVVEPKTVKISALTLLSGVFDPPSITTTGTTERSLPSSASRKKSALSLLQQGSGDSTKPTNSVKTQETSESTPRIFVLCKDTVYFDNVPMYHSQMVIVASNLIGLCLSMATSSQLLLNVVALGVAFGCSTLPTLLPRGVLLRARLSAAAVALWAIKLSILLVYRASILQHDARLDGHLSTFAGRLQFWAFAVVFGLVCSLPHCLGTTSSDPGSNMHLRLGIIVYLAGMAIETVADYQKWNFKQEHSGTEFCQTGLWSMSQHPNYFGEILVWSGIFIVNAPSLVERYPGDSTARRLSCFWRVALAILGPLFVCASLAAQANGSLSNAGELAHVKYGYGTNVVYTKYVDNVPLIVPSPFELFPKMHLEVRPKGKDLKKNRRIFPERVQPAATNDAPVPTFAKVLYPSISPATDSTKDFKSNENPTKLNRDTRTKTPIKEYKAKQIRRNEAAEKRTKVKPSPPKAPKVEAAPVRAGWKFPRLFSRSETKDEHKKMVKRKETKDEHKKMVKRKDMWRLDPDTIFL
jgi:steroid 5-alpha reductase family enzyme